jgi:hypothetical protein
LLLAAVGLLAGGGGIQKNLNRQRAELGLTATTPLENAPPVLAFTTVALGGFRGLISNALWLRAGDLQDEGKYFEMVQLADWITKLQPRFVQVWLVQAWNMAYNISVKFSSPADRWRWVQKGIELLRDEALRYNPNEALIYRELAWFFQHKMGYNLDDAHQYYKRAWAVEMTDLLGPFRTNLAALVTPETDEARRTAARLREQYKLEPKTMQQVDTLYGPLEWRLPEAHAIYWAHVGLELSKDKDKRFLRRVVYQSMKQSMNHGRVITLGTNATPIGFGPDLAKVPKANAAFEQMMADEGAGGEQYQTAHRNFLAEAVYLLYINNRPAQAAQWFKYLKERYPQAVAPEQSLDEFALNTYVGDLRQVRQDRVRAIIEGLLGRSLQDVAVGEDDSALGHELLARKIYETWQKDVERQKERLQLPPFDDMKREVLRGFLDPESGVPPEMQALLRRLLPAAPAHAPEATP